MTNGFTLFAKQCESRSADEVILIISKTKKVMLIKEVFLIMLQPQKYKGAGAFAQCSFFS
jgi:hypothetical protein